MVLEYGGHRVEGTEEFVRLVHEPKSGSWNPADRAKALKCLRLSTAPQFTNRVIFDSVTCACGLRIYQPKSGSSTTADRAKSLKGFRSSTASQFTLRVITDSVTIVCGLTTYLILGGANCRI